MSNNKNGYFGIFGGRYVPETLMPAILELEEAYNKLSQSADFWKEFNYYAKHYIGRPSPLYFAKNLTEHFCGAKIYLKRDELNHTGAHKINHCIGQILVAKSLGKKEIIAETGAGQHGVATATVCRLFNIPCKIFMGAKDVERQKYNVFKMKFLGAEVISVDSGKATLSEAMNAAMRYWASAVESTYYLIGTVAGPHPYPTMVRDFQSMIGHEAREQILEAEGRLPDLLTASIGGGSNSMGLFYPFLKDISVKMIGVEAGGGGSGYGENSASITYGKPGVLHGNLSYYLQDGKGQIAESHSIAAGLDYPGVGPEHAFLYTSGRVQYTQIKDDEAMQALKLCSMMEGIIPAIEPSHCLAYVGNIAPTMSKNQIIIANLCGRGDKDMDTIIRYFAER